mgnify:CR=1 FL=1
MSDIFDVFEKATATAAALVPYVRAVLQPSGSVASRMAAIAALRVDLTASEAALRMISNNDADRVVVARTLLEAALAELDAPDLVPLAQSAVEAALLADDHAVARHLAGRALQAQPDAVLLVLLGANVDANQGRFDPDVLAPLADRSMPPSLRRRVHANLGVALLATGRVRQGLTAWEQAAADPWVLMSPDVGVSGAGKSASHVWIQRMRHLLVLDGLGTLAGTWGIGGPRMVVLLEGLASVTQDPAAAMLLREESNARLRRGRTGFSVDPEQPDITLEDLLADGAEFAQQHGLGALAKRLSG